MSSRPRRRLSVSESTRRLRGVKSRRRFALAPVVECLEVRTVLSTISWTGNAGDGNWNTADNWQGDTVPGAGDVAEIDTDGITITISQDNTVGSIDETSSTTTIRLTSGTLTLNGDSTVAGDFIQTGGTVTGPDSLTISGLTTWSDGTMSGLGTTNAEGGLILGGTDTTTNYSMFLDQRTLNNAGAAEFERSASGDPYDSLLYLSSGATFVNEVGASFSFTDDNTEILDDGGTPEGGTFENDGTLTKLGNSGSSVIGITFNDLGAATFTVSSGTLSLQGGGTISSSSALEVSSGAALDFGRGGFTVTSGITSSGTVSFSGAVVTDTGTYSISGLTLITSGTFDYSGGTALSTGTMTETGGTLTGSGTVNVSGQTTWSGGTMSGLGTTNAEGGLILGDTGDTINYAMFLDQRTFNNAGAAEFERSASGNPYDSLLYLSSGATFVNGAGASLTFTDDNTEILDDGGTPEGGTFENDGTLTKLGNSGSSVIGITFNDLGAATFTVSSGTLSLQGGGTISSSSALEVSSGAALDFGRGGFTVTSGITGSGTVSFSGAVVTDTGTYSISGLTLITSGTFDYSGGTALSTGTMTETGGTLTGSGTVNVSGQTTWSGGTMSGLGTTNAEGGLILGDTGDTINYAMFLDQRTFNNAGAAEFERSASGNPYYSLLYLSSGATFVNEAGASLTFTDDNTEILDDGGAPEGGTVENDGTLTKLGSTGSSVIGSSITFNDRGAGTFTVSSGMFSLRGGGTISSSSALEVASGAVLDFGGGGFTVTSGITGLGDGAVSFSAGAVDMSGTYDVSGSTIAQGGTANLTSPITAVGSSVVVTSGILNLSGGGPALTTTTLAVSGGALTGIDTLNVSGQTTWTGGTMSGLGTTNAEGGLILGDTGDTINYAMFLDQRTFNNAGAAEFERSASGNPYYSLLYLSSGATFVNEAGASLTFTDDNTDILDDGGAPEGGTVENDGTLTKLGSTGSSVIGSSITFNDRGAGTFTVSSGMFSLRGGGTISSSSALEVASGAVLDFGGGSFTVTSGITGLGDGAVSFSAGTVDMSGTYDVSGSTIAQEGTANLTSPITAVGSSVTVTSGILNLSGGGPALTTTTLAVSGGALTGIDTLNVSGQTTWTGGTMSGSGTTNADGGLVLGGTDDTTDYSMSLDQRTFNNAGAAQFQRSASGDPYYSLLYLSSGGTFVNQAGAGFTFTDDNTRILDNGGTPEGGTFENDGTLTKLGSTGSSVLSSGITFDDLGAATFTISSGRLSLQGGGTISSSSALEVSSGAALDFGGGGFTVTSGITGLGDGAVSFSAGTVDMSGTYDVSGSTIAQGGTANLTSPITAVGSSVMVTSGILNLSGGGPALTTTTLAVSGGALTGIDTLNVSGQTTWTGGTMSGSGTTNADGGLVLGGTDDTTDYSMFLDQRTFNNAGVAEFQRSASGDPYYSILYLSSGATFVNEAGAGFSFTDDNTEIVDNGGAPEGGTFENDGTLTKLGSTGSSVIGGSVSLINTGTIEVDSGAFLFQGGGEFSGTGVLTSALGTEVNFASGTFILDDGTALSGLGAITVTGATLDIPSGTASIAASVAMSAGTISGAGTLTLTAPLTWSGGTMSGSGTTNAEGGLTLGGTAAATFYSMFLDQRTFNNAGAARFQRSASGDPYYSYLYVTSGAKFVNEAGAGFDFTDGNTNIQDNGGAPDGGTFENEGTLTKSGGTGISFISNGITLIDTGTIAVVSGTLTFRGGGTITGMGGLSAALGSAVDFNGGTYTLGDGTALSGLGAITVTGATLDIPSGTASIAASVAMSAGTISGAGTLTLTAPLTWSGGTMSGSGTTNAEGGLTLGGTAAATFYSMFLDQRTFNNAGAARFQRSASGDPYYSYLYVTSGAKFVNEAGAGFDFTDGNTNIQDNGGAPDGGTFENEGTLTKSGGTGISFISNGITLIDTGTIAVVSGTLSFRGGGTITGTGGLSAALGSAVDFNGGTYTLGDGTALSGLGAITVTGATLDIPSGTASIAASVAMSAGTISGAGTLTLTAPLTWSGGTMSGSGTTNAEGGLTLGGTAAATFYSMFLDQRTFNNAGAARFQRSASGDPYYSYLYVTSGAKFVNEAGAGFDFTDGNTNIQDNGGAPDGGTFENEGTLTMSDSTGTSTITVALINTGTIAVQTGTLDVTGPFSNFSGTTLTGGTYIINGTFQFNGAAITTVAANIELVGAASRIIDQSDADALAGLAEVAAGGDFTILSGRNDTTAGDLDNAGEVTVGAGSTLTVSGEFQQTAGLTTVNGTLASVAPTPLVDIEGGVLTGSGTVDAKVKNAGAITLDPSSGTGVLTVNGDYTQTFAGTLSSDIDGKTAGSQIGQLIVSGVATLNGTLAVTFFNGFEPNTGDGFQVLNFGSVAGAFVAVTDISSPVHHSLKAAYTPNSLSIILAPAAVAAIGQVARTEGSWVGAYGSDGYELAGDATALPAYAQVTMSGESPWLWAAGTTDPRALQESATPSSLQASCWYSKTSFTVDISFSDGLTHQIAAYLVDWDDHGTRSEVVQVIDPSNGVLLDSQVVSSFQYGTYLTWNVQGEVQIRFTREAGADAVLSGLFFDPPAAAPSAPAGLTATGNPGEVDLSWSETAAVQGFVIERSPDGVNFAPVGNAGPAATSFPDATVTAGQSYTYRVIAYSGLGNSDPSSTAMATAASATVATATYVAQDAATQGNWIGAYGTVGSMLAGDAVILPSYVHVTMSGQSPYSWAPATNDVRALQETAAPAARQAACWYSPTSFTVDVDLADPNPHEVTLYLVDWDDSGLRRELVQVINPVNGAVLDSETVANFAQGIYLSWKVTGDVEFRITREAGTDAVLSGVFLDPPPLLPPAPTGLTATGNPGEVDLAWSESAAVGGFLIERSTDGTDFEQAGTAGPSATAYTDTTASAGQSYTYRVIAFNGVGNSAPSNTATATPVAAVAAAAVTLAQDPTTEGNWVGTYGASGYLLALGATSLPSYAHVTMTGQSPYIWTGATTDPRALDQSPTVTSTGLAACWYSKSSFTVDISLGDGQTHRVTTYLLDWDDHGARDELVQVIDPTSGTVLSSQDVTGFQNGVYLSWNITGHLQIKFTREAGSDAVLSGLFLDPMAMSESGLPAAPSMIVSPVSGTLATSAGAVIPLLSGPVAPAPEAPVPVTSASANKTTTPAAPTSGSSRVVATAAPAPAILSTASTEGLNAEDDQAKGLEPAGS